MLHHRTARSWQTGLLAALLSTSLSAQSVPASPTPLIRRDIPAGIGGGEALRLLDLDADGDLLRDFAIVWSNGELTFAYAPEILSAFTPCPVNAATGATVIQGRFVPQALGGHDGLLVADAGGLAFIALTTGPEGRMNQWTRSAVTASGAWQSVVRVEAFVFGANCYLLGLAPDQVTIRLGTWMGGSIQDLGTMVAGSNVGQMVMVDFLGDGQPTIAARTVAGLHRWSMVGSPSPFLAAPTANPMGALTPFRVGPGHQLAWIVLSGSSWLIRTVSGSSLVTEVQLTHPLVPNRFRLVGIGAIPGAGGVDDLLVYQNSQPLHLRLAMGSNGEFHAVGELDCPDAVLSVDNCPSLCVDIDHDGNLDVATVLTSRRCLQFQPTVPPVQSLPLSVQPSEIPPPWAVLDEFDFCPMTPNAVGDLDTLHLPINAAAYATRANLAVQVVAWPVTVTGITEGNPEGELGTAASSVVYPLWTTVPVGTEPTSFRLPFQLRTSGPWLGSEQYFLMLRFVQCVGPLTPGASGDALQVTWSSEPQMVGCAGSDQDDADLEAIAFYMLSLCTPRPPEPMRTTIKAEDPRNVGTLCRGRRTTPPRGPAPTVPAPGASVVRLPDPQ